MREATTATTSMALESGEPEQVPRYADPDSQPILSQRLVFDELEFQDQLERELEKIAEAPPLPAPAEAPSLPHAPSQIHVVEESQQALPEPEVATVVPAPATSSPPHHENSSVSLRKSNACEERVV